MQPSETSTPSDHSDPTQLRRAGAAGMLWTALALGGVAAIAIFVASFARDPTAGGFASALFLALVGGLLIAVAGAWLAMSFLRGPKTLSVADAQIGDRLQGELADVLAELERARASVQDVIRQRAMTRVPLGAAGGLAMPLIGLFTGDPLDIESLLIMPVGGALLGFGWAMTGPSNEYDRLYKGKVLPALAKSLGGFSYTATPSPDISALADARLFRDFDSAIASDGLTGIRRGLPVEILQLRLTSGYGDDTRTVFEGLLLSVDLPRRLVGTTAVIEDAGKVGNFRDRRSIEGLERVRLEDPKFEQRYEVYGTDQVEARALLNPAFMERLLTLGDLGRYGLPQMLAQDSRMLLALPRTGVGDLFRPPGYRKPAACRETLARLHSDLSAALTAIDAAISLDNPHRPKFRDAGSPST